MKNKHLSFDDRLAIERGLTENLSFKQIGRNINRDCTTISKEIKNHLLFKNTGCYGKDFNNCVYLNHCTFKDSHIKCNMTNCSHYEVFTCPKLSKPPYVCNGCANRNKCTLTKCYYKAEYALKEYKDNLSEVRSGIYITQEEIDHLNDILVPLIKEQGHSIHHALINNKDKIMYSEKQIYKFVSLGILQIRNMDMPRVVRFRVRKNTKTGHKIDKQCTKGRTYQDYLDYMDKYPDTAVVEMDSVEGNKGGKVVLTLHFVGCSFMLSFLRDYNDSQSVIDIFDHIQEVIGLEMFRILFPVILTDNGSEFSNPQAIEKDKDGNIRTKIFYCDPSRPNQKGSCEVNHELIRRIIPKGHTLDYLNQEDIDLMMSHINSYKRKKLNNQSPFDVFSLLYGELILSKLNINKINPNDIILLPSLLKHNKNNIKNS